MLRGLLFGSMVIVGSLLGCGASTPPPESPEVEPAPPPPPPPDPVAAAESEAEPTPPKADKPPAVEPQFTEGMSVEEAIKAVPPGTDRANMDQETLSKPLQEFSVYEPCKPGSAHFTLRVAVWDGRAVGVDVTTTPKNDKLATCIKDQIKALSWNAKVKSLNTVEYSF